MNELTGSVIPVGEERRLPEFNAMQKVKRRFFAMRNGDLAQQMRERGASYRINFGLNLPQVSEIARDFLSGGVENRRFEPGFDMAGFARRLRDNVSTRESMLIAPMLFPVEELTMDEAVGWVRNVASPEVADVLCLKLLRNWCGAEKLARGLLSDEIPLSRYCALRLVLNLLQAGKLTPAGALEILESANVSESPLTATLSRQLSEEIEFLSGE